MITMSNASVRVSCIRHPPICLACDAGCPPAAFLRGRNENSSGHPCQAQGLCGFWDIRLTHCDVGNFCLNLWRQIWDAWMSAWGTEAKFRPCLQHIWNSPSFGHSCADVRVLL